MPVDDLVLSNGLFLGLDLRGDERGQVGHSTRDSAPLLDLTSGGEVDPAPFWDPVFREDGDRLVLSPKRFYLLMSNEAVSIPPNLAAEMTAYDPTSGELRTHYAGFFDPGFGFDPTGGFRGSRAALEVRAHDVPFMVENGQAVCKLTFERMLEEPTVALRVRHRIVVPATRRDAEPVLPPFTGGSGITARAPVGDRAPSGPQRAFRSRAVLQATKRAYFGRLGATLRAACSRVQSHR